MATYYVRKTGSDSSAGTSPGAAWLTIGKALGAGTSVASGDTVYIGAGVYRETITLGTPTSPASVITVIGDVDGSHTGDAGQVILTAYTTNDTTAPAAATTLAFNGKNKLTFQDMIIVGGNTYACCFSATGGEQNVTWTRCAFLPGGTQTIFQISVTANQASNWLFDSCVLIGTQSQAFIIAMATSASANYDANIVFQNCLILSEAYQSVYVTGTGANSFKGGGVDLLNCTAFCGGEALYVDTTGGSTAFPCTVTNCVLFTGVFNALTAATSGQITEDYNLIYSNTPRTNVTAGTHSSSDYSRALLLELDHAQIQGFVAPPFAVPMASSPLLGFGTSSGAPSVDALGRPRPAGGSTGIAAGAFERHDTGVKETTTVRTGAASLAITGPGDHDFEVAVDAVSTTVSVYGRYDSNHASTNKPQMKIVRGAECGVADATATMTAAADTWEQLSITFTPTSSGIVTMRLISRSAAANGNAFFDDMAT